MNASSAYARAAKRLFDFLFALVLAVATLPLLALGMALAAWASGGRVFRARRCVGMDYRNFTARTLALGPPAPGDADDPAAPSSPGPSDDWFDPAGRPANAPGRLLRRLRLDRLPQLWNVAAGSMSFVGPRPLPAARLAECRGWERERFAVRPGLTGLARVNGHTLLDRDAEMYYDVVYARAVSAGTDLAILARTAGALVADDDRARLRPVADADIRALAGRG